MPPSWTSLPPSPIRPSRSSQSTKLSSLCYKAVFHELSVLHTAFVFTHGIFISFFHSLTLRPMRAGTLAVSLTTYPRA